MKANDVKINTKSGNLVRLLSPTTFKLGKVKVKAWKVERIDSNKKLLCPETALKNPEDVLDSDDLHKWEGYL